MRENPPKDCKGKTENGRESCSRNRKRRKKIIDTADADPDQQQDSNQEAKGSKLRCLATEG